MQTIDEMLEVLLKHEGGYTNHPNDRGGPTNWGVTIANYSKYLGRKATIQEVKDMPRSVALDIFKTRFFIQPRINELHEGLQPNVFDMSVNAGQTRGIKLLQEVLKILGYPCSVDGKIGPNTKKCCENAINNYGWEAINNFYTVRRLEFYFSITRNRPRNASFIRGWTRRGVSFFVDEEFSDINSKKEYFTNLAEEYRRKYLRK